jgi:hypothetical protein
VRERNAETGMAKGSRHLAGFPFVFPVSSLSEQTTFVSAALGLSIASVWRIPARCRNAFSIKRIEFSVYQADRFPKHGRQQSEAFRP